jgi:hypothetical protein
MYEAAITHYGEEEAYDYDAKLQAALQQYREEHEFRQRAGARYDRGGGSRSSQQALQGSGPLPKMFART